MPSQWKFNTDGTIEDTIGNKVKFDQLVRSQDGTVYDLQGNPVSISTADAEKLGGLPASDYMTVNTVPTYGEAMSKHVSGEVFVTNKTTALANTRINYKGQGLVFGLPVTGEDILPNVEFNNSNYVNARNDAIISVAENKLRINADVTDNPYGYMNFIFQANELYVIKANLEGEHPLVQIIDPNDDIVFDSFNTEGYYEEVFKPSITGTYKFVIMMNGSEDYGTAIFDQVSIKQLDSSLLSHSHFYTYQENGKKITRLKTDLPSKDINYDPNREYSIEPKNNLAFFKDDFSLLQYVGATPGQDGFVRNTDNIIKNYMKTSEYDYGDFEQLEDINEYQTVGNVHLSHTGDSMLAKRMSEGGDLEVYRNNIIPANTFVMLKIDFRNLVGDWYVKLGDKETKINIPSNSDQLNVLETTRILYTTASETTKLSFICKSNVDTDEIEILDIDILELDRSIWSDITPNGRNTSSKIFEWDNSETIIYRNDYGTGKFKINSIFNTLMGKEKYLDNHTLGTFYNHDSIISYEDDGVLISEESRVNEKDIDYTIEQTSFTRVMLYRDNHNKLTLIASDPSSGVTTMLSQTSGENEQILPTDLNNIPFAVQLNVAYGDFIDNTVFVNHERGSLEDEYYSFSLSDTTPATLSKNQQVDLTEEEHIKINNKIAKEGTILYLKVETDSDIRKPLFYRGSDEPIKHEFDSNIESMLIRCLNTTTSNNTWYTTRLQGFNNVNLLNLEEEELFAKEDRIAVDKDKVILIEGKNDTDINGSVSTLYFMLTRVTDVTDKDSSYTTRTQLNSSLTSTEEVSTISYKDNGAKGFTNKIQTVTKDDIEDISKEDLK